MLMVLARQTIEGQRLLNGLFDPGDQLLVAGAPFGDPGGKIAAGLLGRAPVVQPAQLLQTIIVGLARQMVEGVAQKVDVASLEGCLGQDLADRRAKPRMIVGNDELDPMQASLAQAEEEVLPG